MTFSGNIDLGQTLIGTLLALLTVISWFVKRTIRDVEKSISALGERIDKHDTILFGIIQKIEYLAGLLGAEGILDRRHTIRRQVNSE